MWSWLTVQVGKFRQWWQPIRYQLSISPGLYGTIIRIHDWFVTTKDVEMVVAKNKLKRYKFKIGESVAINRSKRVAIVLYRWRNQWGQILYQCGMPHGKWLCLFHEWELNKTKARIRSEIGIEELEFDLLSDGTWTWKIHPTYYTPFANVCHNAQRTSSLRASYMGR